MKNLPIAVLISGAGSTLENLIRWKNLGELPVDFKLVISSRKNAGGIVFARTASIPVEVVSSESYKDRNKHSEHVFSLCRERGVQLVVMAGYLEHLLIADDFSNRVVNVHPSLIPAFSGKGYYGDRVHQAALDYGVKFTGCSVHFVDNEYDCGPIIAQKPCPIFEQDNVESLRSRVGDVERQLYPEVIAAIARNQVCVDGRHVSIQAIV